MVIKQISIERIKYLDNIDFVVQVERETFNLIALTAGLG